MISRFPMVLRAILTSIAATSTALVGCITKSQVEVLFHGPELSRPAVAGAKFAVFGVDFIDYNAVKDYFKHYYREESQGLERFKRDVDGAIIRAFKSEKSKTNVIYYMPPPGGCVPPELLKAIEDSSGARFVLHPTEVVYSQEVSTEPILVQTQASGAKLDILTRVEMQIWDTRTGSPVWKGKTKVRFREDYFSATRGGPNLELHFGNVLVYSVFIASEEIASAISGK